MNADEAYAVLHAGHPSFPKFFGAAGELDVGVGLILNNVAYPMYNDEARDWDVAEGLVYVVSHECDIAQENDRPFNDAALICPIIPLEDVVAEYLSDLSIEQIRSFIYQLAGSRVDRAIFIPAIPERLPRGGVIYFSIMTSTSVRELLRPAVVTECAVTVPGLKYIDDRMNQALLKRPKDQLLPLAEG